MEHHCCGNGVLSGTHSHAPAPDTCLSPFNRAVASTTGLLSLQLVSVALHMNVRQFLLQLVSVSLAISAVYVLSLPMNGRFRCFRAVVFSFLAFGSLAAGGRGKATSPSVVPTVTPSVDIAPETTSCLIWQPNLPLLIQSMLVRVTALPGGCVRHACPCSFISVLHGQSPP